MINQETLQAILGIKEKVYIKPVDMADHMNITFFPVKGSEVSHNVLFFSEKLKEIFKELNVNIVPYEVALVQISFLKTFKTVGKVLVNNFLYIFRNTLSLSQKNHYFSLGAIKYILKRTKVKKGISIIALGEQTLENMPMQYIYSFKDNSVITILDFPKNINENSTFHDHFDTSVSLFAHHMTNIVIGVDNENWLLYNFNASHPIFPINRNLKENVLKALVPKIVAPIRPYTLSEFEVSEVSFDVDDIIHKPLVFDLVNGALIFDRTSLYPKGKKIDDLPFRNDFYRWIGKLHLDNRNGMSYGFLAIQMPGHISPLIKDVDFLKMINYSPESSIFLFKDELYVSLEIQQHKYWLKVPEVWVLSQKSGSDKTHVKPKEDLIKLGLINGKMVIQNQSGEKFDNNYKTSFDTQVILAHAVGNAIIASIQSYTNPDSEFLKRYLTQGISISHWHGYIHPDHVQKGWFVHGITNPHVACSSPQSALYALQGKLECFNEAINSGLEYKGDVHIEPHHGTNICYTSITELSNYLVNNKTASTLGNSYYYLYNK